MKRITLKEGQEIEIKLPGNNHIAIESGADGFFSVCAWEHDCSLEIKNTKWNPVLDQGGTISILDLKVIRDPNARQGE